MNDDLRNIVLGVIAAGISAALGWVARTYLWRRGLRAGRPSSGCRDHSESLLVVNRKAGGPELTVMRYDMFALLELAALIKDCNARVQIVAHDATQQGFGERTEFCVGGPYSNLRMAAHLSSLLPGVRMNVEAESGPELGALRIGAEEYRMERGRSEYVLLARLTADGREDVRPVFLFCGQRAITNQAATRYLARHHERLARKYGGGSFVLLLKVVNSQAYGPDVVELVADVTREARTPLPEPAVTTE
ncbi:hypothetical protein LT493_23295 [Streptomyces tricolor]|nr:hypothetical protein [Streptomyces tricolor]